MTKKCSLSFQYKYLYLCVTQTACVKALLSQTQQRDQYPLHMICICLSSNHTNCVCKSTSVTDTTKQRHLYTLHMMRICMSPNHTNCMCKSTSVTDTTKQRHLYTLHVMRICVSPNHTNCMCKSTSVTDTTKQRDQYTLHMTWAVLPRLQQQGETDSWPLYKDDHLKLALCLDNPTYSSSSYSLLWNSAFHVHGSSCSV